MNRILETKIEILLHETRVITISSAVDKIPWSAPVYFVHRDNAFYFYSNPKSNHVKPHQDGSACSAVIFQDGNQLDHIYGLQMQGRIELIEDLGINFKIYAAYLAKFDFLVKEFGRKIFVNPMFFLERFNSKLYAFSPEKIWFSDHASSERQQLSPDFQLLSRDE